MATKKVRTLRMGFSTDSGKDAIVSLVNAKSGLEPAEVAEAMDVMIASPIFVQRFTAKLGAEIVEREVTDLF
jgi:Protein of unknown function (DUF2922).